MAHFPRTRVASLAVPPGVGFLLGLAGPLTEKWGNPVCASLNVVFSDGWSWVCYAFLVGYFGRSKIESALLSSLGLAIGVVTYYAFKDLSPTVPAGLESGATGEVNYSSILVWGMAAFALGAPVGLLGNLARIPSVGGLPFRLVVPLVALFETSMQLAAEADGQRAVLGITWNVIRFIAGVVALALVIHAIRSRWHSRRIRSAESDQHRARRDTSPL
ncbi:hypothetical protein C1J00_03720 [Streptomyces cahuitamycinicus]|uniref:Uncharacterized protein n=1 Tax=Streptomyces cahuitamycinicus TaxID=2070367 RepID=A0A2N8TWV2_9ACTN|nr:hypothetical protein C1J00_03720 [Streptomyces cahuitamycinicus]